MTKTDHFVADRIRETSTPDLETLYKKSKKNIVTALKPGDPKELSFATGRMADDTGICLRDDMKDFFAVKAELIERKSDLVKELGIVNKKAILDMEDIKRHTPIVYLEGYLSTSTINKLNQEGMVTYRDIISLRKDPRVFASVIRSTKQREEIVALIESQKKITIILNTPEQVTFEKSIGDNWIVDCSDANLLKLCNREGDTIDHIQRADGDHLASLLHVYFKTNKA